MPGPNVTHDDVTGPTENFLERSENKMFHENRQKFVFSEIQSCLSRRNDTEFQLPHVFQLSVTMKRGMTLILFVIDNLDVFMQVYQKNNFEKNFIDHFLKEKETSWIS